jgi:hypothetical protein
LVAIASQLKVSPSFATGAIDCLSRLISRRPISKSLHYKRKQRKFEQKLTKLAKVRDLTIKSEGRMKKYSEVGAWSYGHRLVRRYDGALPPSPSAFPSPHFYKVRRKKEEGRMKKYSEVGA